MSISNGAIMHAQAYAQGKMLDSSNWAGVLPRQITPSDIDLIFANRGWMLFCELSSKHSSWQDVPAGQRYLYLELAKKPGQVCALCKHCTPQNESIDTMNGVTSFELLFLTKDGLCTLNLPGEYWCQNVMQWFDDPQRAIADWALDFDARKFLQTQSIQSNGLA